MARPSMQDAITNNGVAEKPYHCMIRRLNDKVAFDNQVTVDQLDADVALWLNKGYELFDTQYIGMDQGTSGSGMFSGVLIMYHFVLPGYSAKK